MKNKKGMMMPGTAFIIGLIVGLIVGIIIMAAMLNRGMISAGMIPV